MGAQIAQGVGRRVVREGRNAECMAEEKASTYIGPKYLGRVGTCTCSRTLFFSIAAPRRLNGVLAA